MSCIYQAINEVAIELARAGGSGTRIETFPCTSCGACCRRIGLVKGHGLPIAADGSCGHLEGNLCVIYETRPAICRVDQSLEAFVAHTGESREALVLATAKLCNAFQEEDGMSEEYRVK